MTVEYEMVVSGDAKRKMTAGQSRLMRARGNVTSPAKVNFCPFGCRDEDLMPGTGYCRCLVGFTVGYPPPGEEPKEYEPTYLKRLYDEDGEWIEDQICVQGRRLDENGNPVPNRLPVQKHHKLEKISVSWRVYDKDGIKDIRIYRGGRLVTATDKSKK